MNQRLLDDFLSLCILEGSSGKEDKVAEAVRARLAELELTAAEDDAGTKTGGTTGNHLVELLPSGEPVRWVTLASHMDAVPPGHGLAPFVEDGVVRTTGQILAADDRAGIAILFHLLRTFRESPLRRTGIQAIFTVSEESGVGGAEVLEAAQVRGEFAVVLDTGGPPGQVNTQSPSARKFTAAFTGRSAHAGIEPEKGVNALVMASQLATSMPSGRRDADTTFSFSVLSAGTATNVVPDQAVLKGEVRSYRFDEVERLLAEVRQRAEAIAAEAGGAVSVSSEEMFPPFHVPQETPWVKALFAAAEAEGFAPFAKRSGGGSDANEFNAKGVPAVNVGVGYRQGHSPQEHLLLEEFEGTSRWILRFLREWDQRD